MSEKTLVLNLDAPLQSWGIGAKGTVKTTEREPTLSGVVGLIANAMGRDREDDLSDLVTLTMGSRTDRSGALLRDYYSAGTTTGMAARVESRNDDGERVFKDVVKQEGIVGEKFYLSGASFTVALAGDAGLVDAAAEALARPARILYLGRRSCPMGGAPVIGVYEGGDVEQVLRDLPLRESLRPDVRRRGGEEWVANRGWCADERLRLALPCHPDDPGARMRYDVPTDFSDPHRRYGVRYVRYVHIDRAALMKEAA